MEDLTKLMHEMCCDNEISKDAYAKLLIFINTGQVLQLIQANVGKSDFISREEYEKSLKISKEYKLQLQNELKEFSNATNTKINLRDELSLGTFNAIRAYYHDEYKIWIEWEDAKEMDLEILKSFDLKKLCTYRNFGKQSLIKFNALLDSKSV